jgi:hypothetical protein
VHIHTYVKKSNDKLETFYRGHEEIHVILLIDGQENNGQKIFKNGLETLGIKTERFDQLPKEVKCDLGGIYSMLRKYPDDKSFSTPCNSNTESRVYEWLAKNSIWRLKK